MSRHCPNPSAKAPLILTLALAVVFALSSFAGGAAASVSKPRVSVAPSSGPPGTTFTIKYRAGAARCTVSVKQSWRGGRRQLARSVRRGKRVTFRSKVSDAVGPRRVTVRCGTRERRVFFHIHAAFGKDVVPAAGGDADPFEDLAITDDELAGAPPIEAVGGNGFTTRAPFAKGLEVRVTQSRRGGTSHNKASTLNAVDFAAPNGTPVLAGIAGYVVRAQGGCPNSRSDKCNGGWGNNIVLRAGDGSCVLHAHLSAIEVTSGTMVDRYRQLGRVGTSGYSTGPHLHYDRISCGGGSTQSWEWGLDEAGGEVPAVGRITSQNEPGSPPAPAPAPTGPAAPAARTITVDNRVTNGMGMREDTTPARLNTQPWIRCSSRGCAIGGTERGSGQTYEHAVCQTTGERTTNGHDSSAADDANPERFESNRYYGVRLSNGTFGYVSEVWIRAADRGGLGLPGC